ncbi:MAG: hypothetical protein U1E76_05380 [Planctomycetota bacterium]
MTHHDVRGSFVGLGRWLVVATLAAASGCATPEWQGAHDVTAAYDDYRTGVNLTLVNRSHSQYQDLYSKPRADSNIKIISDADMQLLLAKLDDSGFFAQARPAASALPADQLVGRVQVEIDGRSLALTMPRGLPPTRENLDRAAWFRDVRVEMQQFYNDAFALQTVENQKGPGIFAEQQEKLQKQGSRAGKK